MAKTKLNRPNEADMGERYKNWVESLARYTVLAFKVGKEIGGEAYVKRLEEEFYKLGARSIKHWQEIAEAEEIDCIGMGKIMNVLDDSFANWWDEVENSPKAFEKKILTCPVAKVWGREPELCTRMITASMQGLCSALNPKLKSKWSEFIPTGGKTCHYRIELKK